MAEYFNMIGPEGDRRGLMKVLRRHLTGKTATYRPAKWYEHLWLQLTRKKVTTRKLRYDYSQHQQRS